MGLLSKTSAIEVENTLFPIAEEVLQIKKSKSVGLLKRSEILLNHSQNLDFFSLCHKYNFSNCAVFTKLNDFFCIENSLGFDGLSLITSLSSCNFWDGIITENNKLFCFKKSDNTISPFYQFLSSELKDLIQIIFIIKNENHILFTCMKDESFYLDENSLNKDFNSLNMDIKLAYDNSDKPCIQLNYSDAVLKYIENQNLLGDNYNFLIKSLSNAIFNQLCLNFNKENIIFSNKYILITLSSMMNVPIQLIQQHIKINLKNIIAEQISYLSFEC